jgi:hypothetical protein
MPLEVRLSTEIPATSTPTMKWFQVRKSRVMPPSIQGESTTHPPSIAFTQVNIEVPGVTTRVAARAVITIPAAAPLMVNRSVAKSPVARSAPQAI